MFETENPDGTVQKWNPHRSKLAASKAQGMELKTGSGTEILYLGASTGGTVKHLSNMIESGWVTAVEISPVTGQKLVALAEDRSNVLPVIEDAREPGNYKKYVEDPDICFQDIAQPDQIRIFKKNVEMFSPGRAILCLKKSCLPRAERPVQKIEITGYGEPEKIDISQHQESNTVFDFSR